MSESESDYENTVYNCPKCNGDAKIRTGYETAIICPKCGETKIVLAMRSNGDMETTVEGTGEYYEIEPEVRSALSVFEKAKADDDYSIEKRMNLAKATSELAMAYNLTGREGKAENLAKDSLEIMEKLYSNGAEILDELCDQVSLCAAYASARGDTTRAREVYDSALIQFDGIKTISVATIKVKRGLLWAQNNYEGAETHLLDALEILQDKDTSEFPDHYTRVIAYDALRNISNKKADHEKMEEYLAKSIEERKELLEKGDAPVYRIIELIDILGYYAEQLSRTGDDNLAELQLKDAEEIASNSNCPEALAYAVMNRTKFNQGRNVPMADNFDEEMDSVIEALENSPGKDKRLKENLAQAYMFKSMVRKPEDYDGLVSDIGKAYNLLLDVAYQGDVNEMFLMSVARSYLVLLNMKDQEGAKKVRQELNEIGISQQHLDTSSRSTVGSGGKATKVDIGTNNQPQKPLPGRRLKKQVKKKE